MQVDRHKNQADLTLCDIHNNSKISSATAAGSPVGTLLLGQVVTASSALVRVHVGRRTYGTVALTDIHDGWVDNPAEGITKGMYVKCCVVGKVHGQEAHNQLQLSLQASKGGAWPGQGSAGQSPLGTSVSAVTRVELLKEGQQVKLFVLKKVSFNHPVTKHLHSHEFGHHLANTLPVGPHCPASTDVCGC